MSRLVIVSNRVGLLPNQKTTRAGGLEVAIRDTLDQLGDGLWFGWSGEIGDSAKEPTIVKNDGITYATVDLRKTEFDEYYVGFANSTLWPLLHYSLEFIDYRDRNFTGYLNVNHIFATSLHPLLQPDDIIWVHDYHLIPLGLELRKLGVTNRIGFFLHVPFPPPGVLAVLPNYKYILKALCSYDLVGFQTEDHVRAFLNCITELADGQNNNGVLTAFNRTSRAQAFPIGIDTENFANLARLAMKSPEAVRLRASLAKRILIIGVDRLDYSKGLPNRFAAIDTLLTEHPEHLANFTYLQIAPHSRSEVPQYRSLRRELEEAAGRVNGKYSEFDWSPIRYLNRSFSRRTLAAFFRLARIGLVTPLRDGMNLVAKEYVAAQDSNDPGVLVLSSFAGAANELQTALLVNPLNIDEIARALHQAISMTKRERLKRWKPMINTLRQNDIIKWREDFLIALRG